MGGQKKLILLRSFCAKIAGVALCDVRQRLLHALGKFFVAKFETRSFLEVDLTMELYAMQPDEHLLLILLLN